ncbi:MAG: hypothetical protein V3U36_00575 [Anaerolineales bacterium]
MKDTKNYNSPDQVHKFAHYFQSIRITSVSIDEIQKNGFPLESVKSSGKDPAGFIKQHWSTGKTAASCLKLQARKVSLTKSYLELAAAAKLFANEQVLSSTPLAAHSNKLHSLR